MFKGIHNINLDSKGRLTIPTKYRNTIDDQSDGKLVVTIDSEEKCLLLYPSSVWLEIEKKINSLPSFNKNSRRIQRLLIGHAEEIDLDTTGRILLSKPLRLVAEMSKKVTLIGQGEKFEIWSEEIWNNRVNTWRSEETDESDDSALSDIRI
ncbi:MAG: cell division/cell wall cluster transcriptional repressor MraZ [Gammaproteobacteria bacterium]|nr:cell division/cell wall cluster transcriptional repressor MraZ [Gammaproteobacteria bacterium]